MTIRDVIERALCEYQPPIEKCIRTGPRAKVGSMYALSRRTGISQSCLSRFRSGKTGLNMANLEALCNELGLIVATKKG